MQIDFAFLCDYADVSGKINALGIGFTTILAPELPVVHQQMHLVVQFRASVAETGRKEVSVKIIDADGIALQDDISGIVEIKSPIPGVEGTARLHVAIMNLKFLHFGDYALHVVVDNNEMHRIPFEVKQPPSTS